MAVSKEVGWCPVFSPSPPNPYPYPYPFPYRYPYHYLDHTVATASHRHRLDGVRYFRPHSDHVHTQEGLAGVVGIVGIAGK